MLKFRQQEILTLISDIRSGKHSSFVDLCELYAPLIDNMCSRYSPPLEEDESRQIFTIALYDAATTYNTEQTDVTFGAYAGVCMRNRAVSELRRHKPTVSLPDEEESLDLAASAEDEAIARESYDELIRHIRVRLSDHEREALGMYLAGKSYAEMARLTGRSEKSIGTAITRAKAKLRRKE